MNDKRDIVLSFQSKRSKLINSFFLLKAKPQDVKTEPEGEKEKTARDVQTAEAE
jgi:hypothetical protein